MRTAAATLAVLLALAGTAWAAEQLAVVIIVEGEPATSDSLAEIAIAHLAESRGGLVGLRELRGRLPTAPDGRTLEACLGGGGCLTELGRASGAQKALIGTLAATPEKEWRLELSLADTQTGVVVQSTQRTLPRDFSPLADGLRAAIDELLPPPKLDLAPPAPPPAPIVVQSPGPPRVAPIARSTIVGLSFAGLAAAAFVTGAVLGASASSTPEGATRADAQADLHRRENQATASTALLVTGGALAAVSAGILIWNWR